MTRSNRHRWLALALSCPCAYGYALGVGELSVLSYLGQPFLGRVPYTHGAEEVVSEECISLTGPTVSDSGPITTVGQLRAEVKQAGSGKGYLIIRGSQPLQEPVARMQLKVACGSSMLVREFVLLLDPPVVTQPLVDLEPVAPRATIEPRIVELPRAPRASLPALDQPPAPRRAAAVNILEHVVAEGETLDSIAATFHPNDAAAQRLLKKAIAAANSDVLADENSPLPSVGTPLIVPDLGPGRATAPVQRRAKPRKKPRPAPQPIAAFDAPQQPEPKVNVAPMRPRANRDQPSRFVLRLSRGELDLSQSANLTDEQRTTLRERQRLLDADDQTAALLALQHEMRQMKAEIAELREKLNVTQQTAAPIAAAPAPSAAPTPAAVPTPAAAPTPAAEVPAPKPPVAATQPVVTAPTPQPTSSNVASAWAIGDLLLRWWWVPLAVLGLLLGGLLLKRRSTEKAADEYLDAAQAAPAGARAAAAAAAADSASPELDTRDAFGLDDIDVPVTPPAAAAPAMADTGADFAQRYMTDRFPEVPGKVLDLNDADAVVDAARLYFVDDGDADRAIELLEFSIDRHPAQPKTWLALFEIYRQIMMKGAFEKLARRFKDQFSDAELWSKVRVMGAALDPINALYRDGSVEEVAHLDLGAPPQDAPSQPNWLDLPLDFTPTLKGEELRLSLLSELADLRPEPGKQAQEDMLDLDLDELPKLDRVEPTLKP